MNVHAMIRSLDVIQSELDRLRADLESGLPGGSADRP